MPKLSKRTVTGSPKAALITSIKKTLTDGTIWDEYTRDDYAHYLSVTTGLSYKNALYAITGTEFILKLEDEINKRKENDSFCDCIPLLSPYYTSFNTLSLLDSASTITRHSTPYTIMGLASIATIRLYHLRDEPSFVYGQGVPAIVAYWLGMRKTWRMQAILHSKMKYRCLFCSKSDRPFYARLMTRLLFSMSAYINKQLNDNAMELGSPFVAIKR